tara:strand:- start:330 stop:467 length:138 start_codon:yes stop_codon:yes gene_type:complete
MVAVSELMGGAQPALKAAHVLPNLTSQAALGCHFIGNAVVYFIPG